MNTMNSDTNNDRPTPITDASLAKMKLSGYGGLVELGVSRDLERQLAEARYQRDVLADAVEQLMTYRPNGLSGEDQHEIAVWREVVDALSQTRTPQPPTP